MGIWNPIILVCFGIYDFVLMLYVNDVNFLDLHIHYTRRRNYLISPKFRLQKTNDSHMYIGVKFYNKVSLIIRQIRHINIWKSRVKNFIKHRNFEIPGCEGQL